MNDKGSHYNRTTIETDYQFEGQSIEEKMRKVTEMNEPIEDVAPMIYTERKDGVLPQYDIRTDRFDIAIEAMDAITASNIAKREHAEKIPTPEKKTEGEGEKQE